MALNPMTKEALTVCRLEFEDEKPAAPTGAQIEEAPDVVSMTSAAVDNGVAFSLVVRDEGRDTTKVLFFNPVAAKHLADMILAGGWQAGWLDERGNITPASSDRGD